MARDDPRPTEAERAEWDDDRRERYEAGQRIDENPTRTTWTIDGRELSQVEFLHHNYYLFFADRYREAAARFISAFEHLLFVMETRTNATRNEPTDDGEPVAVNEYKGGGADAYRRPTEVGKATAGTR